MGVYIRAIIVTFVAVCGSYIIHSYPKDYLPTTQGEIGVFEVFFSVLGTIYAVMSGFVMLVVLENYTKIKANLSDEVNSLQDLRDYLIYVDNQEDTVIEIKQKLKIYVDSLVDVEWKVMMKKTKMNVDTSPELYDLMRSINKLKADNHSDVIALEKLIDVVGHITTYRTERLAACSEALPRSLTQTMFALSGAVIIIFMLVPVGNFSMIIALNCFVAFVVTMIYGMIQDLNNPFKGSWRVKPDLFRDLQKHLHEMKMEKST